MTQEYLGLVTGQMRNPSITHNSGWYDRNGVKLGWGDLGPEDFMRISQRLESGELLFILSEANSSRNRVGSDQAPGIDYVVQRCMYIIGKGRLYVADHDDHRKVRAHTRNGLEFSVLPSTEAVKELLAS